MSETPEQIWINKIHGRHPEDWSFSVGAWETQSQLKEKVKYIRPSPNLGGRDRWIITKCEQTIRAAIAAS